MVQELLPNSFLTIVVDDLFDVSGSEEELLNFIELVEKWDLHKSVGFCSKQVEIIFSALSDTLNELADKAFIAQGRCVKHLLNDIWLYYLKSMMTEAERMRTKTKNTDNGRVHVSGASDGGPRIVLFTLHKIFWVVGTELSQEVVRSEELNSLYILISIIGRHFNDLASPKREILEGKRNSMWLYVDQSNGDISEEEVKTETRRTIESNRRKLLQMVLPTKQSLVPKDCKDLFWKTNKILHQYYMSSDEVTSPQKVIEEMNSVILGNIENLTDMY